MNAIWRWVKKLYAHRHRWEFIITSLRYPYGFVKYCRVCGEMIPAKFSHVEVK
jgi:hypothetical protein